MVAFELAALEEKGANNAEAVRWYTTAAERFRRADWKSRAEDALTRLGAPIPAGKSRGESMEGGSSEAALWLRTRDRAVPRLGRLLACSVVAAGVFVGLLAALDHVAAPYDDIAHRLVGGGVLGEISHIINYGAGETSPNGPTGIASYPWGWLVDYKPIVYLNINPAQPAPGLGNIHPAVHFLGLISPPILLLALPALALAAVRTVRWPIGVDFELAAVSVAWFAGSFLPFVLFSLLLERTSYLYYMVVVMPGMYAAVAWLLPRVWHRRRLVAVWIMAVLVAAVVAYPLTPLP